MISDNGTHYLIYFEFPLSIHGVTIEFAAPLDIATTEVEACKPVVGEGYSVDINVTVANQGDYTEYFNVSVFYDDTIITLPNGDNYTTATVASGNSITLTVTWNTSGVSKGSYTLNAYAPPILGETDVGDNSFAGGVIRVGIPGDVDPIDGYVGIDDIFAIASRYGHEPPNWDPDEDPVYDITNDVYIDVDDIFIAASHFGEEE